MTTLFDAPDVQFDDASRSVDGDVMEPRYTTTTERIYRRLPEAYRTLDVQNDWQFKKFISSITDQLDEINTLLARFRYVSPDGLAAYNAALNQYNTYTRPAGLEDPTWGWDPIPQTSDLLDGRTADASWLPYIAQLIGGDLRDAFTVEQQRDVVVNNYLGFRAGSREALEAAVLDMLTGDKYVRVYPHRDGAGGSVTNVGTEWDILVITKPSESIYTSQQIVDEVVRKGAKPAGVILHHIFYGLIWSDLESNYPTWTSIEAAGSWSVLEAGNAEILQ